MSEKKAIDFPSLIRKLRISLNETQEQFAERFNTHANTVSRWESGKYRAPYIVIDFVLRHQGVLVTCPVCQGTGKIVNN